MNNVLFDVEHAKVLESVFSVVTGSRAKANGFVNHLVLVDVPLVSMTVIDVSTGLCDSEGKSASGALSSEVEVYKVGQMVLVSWVVLPGEKKVVLL